jgi:predicted nucleic acid-binding protein
MNVVDANLVITFLVRHTDPLYPAAREVMKRNFVIVPATVLLELEWVLRTTYKLNRSVVAATIEQLLALPNVASRPEGVALKALDWSRRGLDLPDALHLAATEDAETFITADRTFARRARDIADAPRVELLQESAP